MIRRANKNKNETNETNLEVMNYLIQKLDSRQKKIIKFKNLFKEFDSFESFYSQRKEIYILLNELEEDLKQASFAIKALLLQNKVISKDINIKINENKTILNQLNCTIAENQNLKLKLNNINEIQIPNIEFNNDINNNNNNNNNLLNVNINSIKVDEEEEYEEPKIKNLDIKDNNINYNMNNFEKQNKYQQLSNIKNIMKEMRNNKKNLKKIIEQHFKLQKMS